MMHLYFHPLQNKNPVPVQEISVAVYKQDAAAEIVKNLLCQSRRKKQEFLYQKTYINPEKLFLQSLLLNHERLHVILPLQIFFPAPIQTQIQKILYQHKLLISQESLLICKNQPEPVMYSIPFPDNFPL